MCAPSTGNPVCRRTDVGMHSACLQKGDQAREKEGGRVRGRRAAEAKRARSGSSVQVFVNNVDIFFPLKNVRKQFKGLSMAGDRSRTSVIELMRARV